MEKIDFEAAWALLRTAQRIEASVSHGRPSLDMEFMEGDRADWFLVQTYPGDDARALRWLARRRFGVFQPMQQRFDRNNPDRKFAGYEPVFPGWLFVFCWNIEKMKWRMLNCPGVMSILCDPVSERPFPIDDSFIDRLRALGWVYDERAPNRSHAAVRAGRQAQRPKRSVNKLGSKERKQLARLKSEMVQLGAWDDVQWREANDLEPGKRIRLLMAELDKHRRCGWPSTAEGS